MRSRQDELQLVVEIGGPELRERGEELARELGAVATRLREPARRGRSARRTRDDDRAPPELVMRVSAAGLSLRLGSGPEVVASGSALKPPEGHGPDPLWRAVLSGEFPVVDATAGLGGDGFHLAARGAQVTLIERSPVVAALLRDALERALAGELGPDASASAGRVRLLVGDARDLLRGGGVPPESAAVVYLDPMFHDTGRRSLPPKGMALFRALMGTDEEGAGDLLAAAREAASRRVVVKRHLKAPPLGDVTPSGDIRTRSVRFDLYPPV